MATRLLIATTNPHKLREIRRLLADTPVEVVGLGDYEAIPEPEETGTTFGDNARLKAHYYDARLPQDPARYTAAEDSGLVIDALGGEPGVQSARFLRSDASYPERFAAIFERMAGQPAGSRGARFVCALAVVRQGALVFEATGVAEGEITREARGTGGFGYDPIFFHPPSGRTFAEIGDDEKQRVGHRGQAFSHLAAWLRQQRHPG